MKTLLFPLDGSPQTEEALLYGISQYPQGSCRFILFNCICIQSLITGRVEGPGQTIKRIESAEQESLSYLQNKASFLREAGHKVRIRVRPGNPVEEILRLAQDEEVDQIVFTSRGRGRIRRLLGGSVAEKVTRRATCAVLSIPGVHGRN